MTTSILIGVVAALICGIAISAAMWDPFGSLKP